MNAARLLTAQRLLTSSFTPESDEQQIDRVEMGAIGIYGEVTGRRSFREARTMWATRARPLTKERHRAESRACLAFASL